MNNNWKILFRIWIFLMAGVAMLNLASASTIDASSIMKKTKIEKFDVVDLDVFESCSKLWETLRKTVVKGDDPSDPLLSSFGFAVYAPNDSAKKSFHLEEATIEQIIKKISEIYEVQIFTDDWYVVFSKKNLIFPLVDSNNYPKDSDLEIWSFPNIVMFENFDITKIEHQEFLKNSFKSNSSIGKVEFITQNINSKIQGFRLDILGKWRYAEFFSLVRKTTGKSILMKKVFSTQILIEN